MIGDMKVLCLIPVRMGSHRFPGKPLAKINGKTMVQTIYDNTQNSKYIDNYFIITEDEIIKKEVLKFTSNVLLTDKHSDCIIRSVEGLDIIETNKNKSFDYIVIVQGDEPLVTTVMVDKAIEELYNNSEFENWCDLVNVCSSLSDFDVHNLNAVKVFSENDKMIACLYGRRVAVPKLQRYKQTGIFVLRREILKNYRWLSPTFFEEILNIDMLRFLENKYKIKLCYINKYLPSVDVPSDIDIIEKEIKCLSGKF